MQSLIFVQTKICGLHWKKRNNKRYHGTKYTEGPEVAWGLPVEAEFSRFVLKWDEAESKTTWSGGFILVST